jgi:hypothetical protein
MGYIAWGLRYKRSYNAMMCDIAHDIGIIVGIDKKSTPRTNGFSRFLSGKIARKGDNHEKATT